mgnify:FL=1
MKLIRISQEPGLYKTDGPTNKERNKKRKNSDFCQNNRFLVCMYGDMYNTGTSHSNKAGTVGNSKYYCNYYCYYYGKISLSTVIENHAQIGQTDRQTVS